MKFSVLSVVLLGALVMAACSQSGRDSVDNLFRVKADISPQAYLQRAENGAAEDQFIVANMYYWGDGFERSESEAMQWWARAADGGHEKARANLERAGNGEAVQGELGADRGRLTWAGISKGLSSGQAGGE